MSHVLVEVVKNIKNVAAISDRHYVMCVYCHRKAANGRPYKSNGIFAFAEQINKPDLIYKTNLPNK